MRSDDGSSGGRDDRPDPDALLARVVAEDERARRGRLRVFLGYAAGVGKTYAMLQAGQARRAEGVDVVIAYVETHARPETTALEALRAAGLSDRMINGFLRPFLAGVFFDEELTVSSRAFEFVFRAFAAGDTALPAQGMSAIPAQLAAGLPPDTLRLNCRVERLDAPAVFLISGERLTAPAVVIATDGFETARLLAEPSWPGARATTCLYFAAPEPPVREPLLVLNGEGAGPINSLVVPSVLSPAYAPPGQALVTVNVLGDPAGDDHALLAAVSQQLRDWFGPGVEAWRRLRIYRIARALPLQTPPVSFPETFSPLVRPGLFVCGEYRSAPSIQWALASGRRTGEAVAAVLRA